MKKFEILLPAIAALLLAACSEDEPAGGGSGGDGGSDASEASLGDLTTFDIAIDTTALEETEEVPSDDEDYLENNTFGTVVTIAFDGTQAAVGGAVDGVDVTVSEADVTVSSSISGVRYSVSGSTSDGFLKIYSEKKFELDLNGVDITNPDGAAINIQSSKRCYLVLADGTTNKLTDGDDYTDAVDGEDMKATLFSEGKLLFSGSGKLEVYANCKAGIRSDDYLLFRPGNNVYVKATAGNAIKANDAITVRGGVINVEVSAAAAKGLSSDGFFDMSGGRVTALTTGTGEYDSDEADVSGCAGVKADSTLTVSGGTLLCKSTGAGGKGVSCDSEIIVSGGEIRVITTGQQYVYGSLDTSPKGIKSDGAMLISGGEIMVRASGGEGSEGIESKSTLDITGGTIQSYCYDDAINSSGNLTISGGYVYAYGSGNDGIDSNSSLTVSGGVVIACGTTTPESGMDCDESGTFTVTGGTLIGIGGTTSTPSSRTTTQACVIVGATQIASGSYIALSAGGSNVFAFMVPRSYSGGYTLLVSSPSLSVGGSCAITTGATVSGGTDFNGYVTGATVSGGTQLASLSLNSIVTTQNFRSFN